MACQQGWNYMESLIGMRITTHGVYEEEDGSESRITYVDGATQGVRQSSCSIIWDKAYETEIGRAHV